MITLSSSRSARSNSSARKLRPSRITTKPGPGTPGPDITIPTGISSAPSATTATR